MRPRSREMDVSNWDTSSVTSLYETFEGATSFTGDGLSNWDTSSVTTEHSPMRPRSTGDVSNWDISSVLSRWKHYFTHRCDLVQSTTRDGVKLGVVV